MDLINTIKELDTRLFLLINGTHDETFDTIMYWTSYRFTWIPLYLLIAFLIAKHYKLYSIVIFIAVPVLILGTDQISVHCFKEFFMRYRPCHNLVIQSQVHLNGDCGGMYGFISSHAANTFGLATLVFLLFREKIRWLAWFMFAWAAFVCYSRIYNGVHYPADVTGGVFLGILLGALTWLMIERFIRIKTVMH